MKGYFGSGFADQIVPGLWQGGLPVRCEDMRNQGFSALVLCAMEIQPYSQHRLEGVRVSDEIAKAKGAGVTIVSAPMDDAELTPEEAFIAKEAAKKIVKRLEAGKNVLVTCQQGRNRSGLVCALTLVLRYGISGAEAAEKVRAARVGSRYPALTNETFVKFLKTIPAIRSVAGAK